MRDREMVEINAFHNIMLREIGKYFHEMLSNTKYTILTIIRKDGTKKKRIKKIIKKILN